MHQNFKSIKRMRQSERAAVQKNTYCGRHLRTEETPKGKARSLHATKGWRERRPVFMQDLHYALRLLYMRAR
jgi:hypothetical protein